MDYYLSELRPLRLRLRLGRRDHCLDRGRSLGRLRYLLRRGR